jgi:peptide subunit release factor RF-3
MIKSNYIYTIDRYSIKELLEEEEKLSKVLSNLSQEHQDRIETIRLVSSQLDQVRNLKAFKYEEPFESGHKSGNSR